MEIKINIDEDCIKELVTQEIVRQITMDKGYIGREGQYGIRDGVDKAIQKYIYKEKDYIINKVIERASVEIVKKGLPKLLENLGKGIGNE